MGRTIIVFKILSVILTIKQKLSKSKIIINSRDNFNSSLNQHSNFIVIYCHNYIFTSKLSGHLWFFVIRIGSPCLIDGWDGYPPIAMILDGHIFSFFRAVSQLSHVNPARPLVSRTPRQVTPPFGASFLVCTMEIISAFHSESCVKVK